MIKSNGKGRPKMQYDSREISEIIELKLKSVNNDINKLTYNSVFKFNQYLVESRRKNSRNENYNLYGYSFWATDYKGIPNYGKEQIDLYKQRHPPIIAGEVFEVAIDDIITVIDYNQDDLNKMKKMLIKIFQKERKSNAINDRRFLEMQQELNEYKKLVNQYKQALFMMFYNSKTSNNSLNDVITLKTDGDRYIQNEIYNIFNGNVELIDEIACNKENAQYKKLKESLNDNVLDLAKILDKRDK